MTKRIEGACLCGAVTVGATVADVPKLFACHCEMCRRQNSAMLLSVETDQDSIEIAGPVKLYDSSDWAQRAFCETCGSSLWYGLRHDGSRHLAAGLFPETGGTVDMEFFCDEALKAVAVQDAARRLTRDETFAMFAPDGEAGA